MPLNGSIRFEIKSFFFNSITIYLAPIPIDSYTITNEAKLYDTRKKIELKKIYEQIKNRIIFV